MNILIIDDDSMLLKFLQSSFTKEGFTCKAFYNPAAALKEFERNHYDLVITDFEMPKITGIEVISRVKEAKPETNVIMICGYVNDYIKKEAENQGVYAFFEKPIDIKQLVSDIKSLDTESSYEETVEETVEEDTISLDEKDLFLLEKVKSSDIVKQIILKLKDTLLFEEVSWDAMKTKIKLGNNAAELKVEKNGVKVLFRDDYDTLKGKFKLSNYILMEHKTAKKAQPYLDVNSLDHIDEVIKSIVFLNR